MAYAEPNPDRLRVITLTPDEKQGIDEVMREALPKIDREHNLGAVGVYNFVLEEERELRILSLIAL
jgi:hypothetical protein